MMNNGRRGNKKKQVLKMVYKNNFKVDGKSNALLKYKMTRKNEKK